MRSWGIFNTFINLWLEHFSSLCLCLCLCLSLNTFAQPNLTLPPYRQYTLRDGLSQMQVTCMMQDSRGYIWVGTKAGLNCFNGEKFTQYTRTQFPEIIDDHIHEIKEDGLGRIWASTNSGILRIDGHQIRFFRVAANPPPSITPGKGDRLWFVQSHAPKPEYQICFIEKDSIHQLQAEIPGNEKLTQRILHYYEPENILLLALNSKLYGLKKNRFEAIDTVNALILPFTCVRQKAYYLNILDTTNSFRDGLRDSDLKKFEDGKTVTIARIRNGQYLEKPDLSDSLFLTQPFPEHAKVILTPDSISYHFNQGIELSNMISDRDRHIWLGSEEGLFQLFDNGFTVYNKDLLPQIWAVIEDQKGTFWFSSYLNGFYKLEQGNLKHFPNDFKKGVFSPYFHPVMDKRGRLFFPDAYGILMVDGDRFEQYTEINYLTTWYDNRKDLVWGGSRKRAVAFDAKRRIVRRIDESLGLDVGNNVLTIGRDTAGFHWFGGGRGLARYDWETNRLKNYNPGGQNWGVPTQCNDFKGRTWFGSKGGLLYYDAAADSLVRIDREELSDVVNMVGTIDSTWLIASQPYGIYLIDLRKYYSSGEVVLHLFNEKNGFLGVEPGQDGVFTDSKGNVWMTTSTEVVKLDPRKLKTVRYSLNVRLDKCNGKKLPFSAGEIDLPRNQSSAVITLDAICFNRPNPEQYSWKFAKDKEWSPWQEENYIVLSGLPDGKHLLEVRARVKGLSLEKPALTTQVIRVRMAFYRQLWFFPVGFTLLSLLGTGFLIFALTGMRKAGRDARIFQVQAIQSQMNPHFIFNVLASLQTMILKADISKANDYLVKLADLVRGFLEASAGSGTIKNPLSGEGLVSLESELKMLSEFVEFQQEINPGRFEYRQEISEEVDARNLRIPPMLIQPFVENSIRHGLLPSDKPGRLTLRVNQKTDLLVITITDNGIGMEKAAEMNRTSALRYISRGKELTLKRISLLNKLGFHIQVDTQSDYNGTTITITMK